jgi:tripeptide aminopeptidase
MQELAARSDVHPVGFQSDAEAETNADWTVLCSGDLDAAEAAIMEALRAQCEPHAWRGARAWVTAREEGSSQGDSDGLRHVAQHLQAFLTQPGVQPRLSEESEGREGYSNPYFLSLDEGAWRVDYRLRDFDKAGLAAREEHVRAVAQASGIAPSTVEIVAQYDNMGPTLAPYPELVDWALSALEPLGVAARQYPIRGGTGVDPFVERSIPVANLGTGYFAPESEKELTSRQNIARHSAWLINLVQVIAGAPSSER